MLSRPQVDSDQPRPLASSSRPPPGRRNRPRLGVDLADVATDRGRLRVAAAGRPRCAFPQKPPCGRLRLSCVVWQAPASTQKTKRKTRPAIRRSARWRANPRAQRGPVAGVDAQFSRTPPIGVSGFVSVWALSIFSSSCVVVRAWCLESGGAATGGGAGQ